jgi:hypothetical protein
VIAIFDDEFVCRQPIKQGAEIRLHATRVGHAEIVVLETGEFQVQRATLAPGARLG